MLYELRIYHIHPGKMQAINDRFSNHTLRIFAKHGIKVIDFGRISTLSITGFIMSLNLRIRKHAKRHLALSKAIPNGRRSKAIPRKTARS